MLVEFRVENHRSIREEQALSLEAGRVGDPDDPVPREIGGTTLLPVAALYGANASGKSNVLDALAFMRDAVILSHRAWEPEAGVPQDPFAWGPSASAPSVFEVVLLLDGVRYQYGFAVDRERILEEWLFAWPRGRKQIWFEREGDAFKFGEHLQGENRLIEKVTRNNALFLSAAAQHDHEQLLRVYRWFLFLQPENLRGRHPSRLGLKMALWQMSREAGSGNAHENAALNAVLAFLRAADVGILDFKLLPVEGPDGGARLTPQSEIMVRHQSAEDSAWLPLDEESHGTRTLFQMAPNLLHTLRRGSLLVVDELEASLHPLVALHIVRQFNDPQLNPNHAQLLFSTHDTNLLGTTTGGPALRRDQVWLTEKDAQGATCLYPLTDYKPRKSENLERGYLQGRYGAIPFLGPLARVGE